MRVQLLGTGSADRWPNPWCRCASCTWAREAGQIRGRTSALVDDTLLIDPGPDAGADGVDLSAVRIVLVTHDHPDHLDPAFLLAWQWAVAARPGPTDRLVVAGPAQAVDRCSQWVAPDAPVRLQPLVAGDVLDAGQHRVRALTAAHSTTGSRAYDGTALIYQIATQDARVLYATDTGALPRDEISDGLDLVLLEETFGDFVEHGTAHLDLPTFCAEVTALRDAGRLAPGARVIAVHLSHHNGPDLAQRLAPVGAEVVADGTVVTVGTTFSGDLRRHMRPPCPSPGADAAASTAALPHEAAEGPVPAHADPGSHSGGTPTVPLSAAPGLETPRRPRRMLVTGGARSGKSHHAESVAAAHGGPITYVATAPSYADDPEWVARIAAHRARRPRWWRTLESPDVAGVLRAASAGECVLVDCLALWLTALLDRLGWEDATAVDGGARSAIADLQAAVRETLAEVVLVTNEVGSGIVPDQPSGRLFRDLLGRTNVAVAAACSEVALVTAGIPVLLKGEPWTRSS